MYISLFRTVVIKLKVTPKELQAGRRQSREGRGAMESGERGTWKGNTEGETQGGRSEANATKKKKEKKRKDLWYHHPLGVGTR